MGTRNLTMVRIDKQIRVAQYGQWDGYPAGAGVEIQTFLRNYPINEIRSAFRKVRFISKEEQEDLMQSIGFGNKNWFTMDESEIFRQELPTLHRDTGAEVLDYLVNDPSLPIRNNFDFGYASLFCEWGYLIDLDFEVVQIFKGFNKKPLIPGEMFYKPEQEDDYYGISLVREYPIKDYIVLDLDELEDEIEEEKENNEM